MEPSRTTYDDDAEEVNLYASAMNRHPLLDRDAERAIAVEIEERSRELWCAIFSDRAMVARVVRHAIERLPAAAAVLRRVERAAGGQGFERAVRKASERLHVLDVDHVVADEVVARIGARCPAVVDASRAAAEARSRFVQANIALVFHLAARYRSTSLSFEDFVQEGMFGLIKAVDRFDHRRGFRFSTYAGWWIRHSMGRALADKSRLVRVPVHLQETRNRLGSVQRTLRSELAREPSRDEIARAAGISREKVERIQQANAVSEIPLDAPIGDDEDRSRADIFLDPDEAATDTDDSLHRRALATAARQHMAALSAMEREVLHRRFGLDGSDHEATLREIAKDHGLSRERVRQIQESALRKLRAQLRRLDDR